jgi:hypothetical protein
MVAVIISSHRMSRDGRSNAGDRRLLMAQSATNNGHQLVLGHAALYMEQLRNVHGTNLAYLLRSFADEVDSYQIGSASYGSGLTFRRYLYARSGLTAVRMVTMLVRQIPYNSIAALLSKQKLHGWIAESS